MIAKIFATAALCLPAVALTHAEPRCGTQTHLCICTQTTDPRSAIGYDPLSQSDGGRQTVSAPWVCIDYDKRLDNSRKAVAYHADGANIASDPRAGRVQMASPDGLNYSSAGFIPPNE